LKPPHEGLVSGAALLLWTSSAKAQEAAQDAAHRHHPSQDQVLHEKFYSTCTGRIIRRSAAATTQTVTLPRSNMSTASSMRGGGKTGSIFSFRPRRSSETGIVLAAEITFARHRRPFLRLTRSIASHWEAPHEIHPGEWQNSHPDNVLPTMLRKDQWQLCPRNQDPPTFLRLSLLRAPL
jgi:hypothetical protein